MGRIYSMLGHFWSCNLGHAILLPPPSPELSMGKLDQVKVLLWSRSNSWSAQRAVVWWYLPVSGPFNQSQVEKHFSCSKQMYRNICLQKYTVGWGCISEVELGSHSNQLSHWFMWFELSAGWGLPSSGPWTAAPRVLEPLCNGERLNTLWVKWF